ADLPALARASVAPVEGTALPAELTHVRALGDVAPDRAHDARDRRSAERGHDALRRFSASVSRPVRPSSRARRPDRARPAAAWAAVSRIRSVRQSSHGHPGAPWRGDVLLIGLPPLVTETGHP